jgi:hypothetical protein
MEEDVVASAGPLDIGSIDALVTFRPARDLFLVQ